MYNNILVTLDGSDLAESALSHLEIAYKGCGNPKVTVLRVIEPLPTRYGGEAATGLEEIMQQAEAEQEKDAKLYMDTISSKLSNAGIPVTTKLFKGNAAEVIIDFIEKNGIDLLIIATHGRSGISRWVWGSVTDRVLRSICIPVTVVPSPSCGLRMQKK